MKSVPSENMLALRKLTDDLSKEDLESYKDLIMELKSIFYDSQLIINETKNSKTKIMCYENMYTTITSLLNEIKIY